MEGWWTQPSAASQTAGGMPTFCDCRKDRTSGAVSRQHRADPAGTHTVQWRPPPVTYCQIPDCSNTLTTDRMSPARRRTSWEFWDAHSRLTVTGWRHSSSQSGWTQRLTKLVKGRCNPGEWCQPAACPWLTPQHPQCPHPRLGHHLNGCCCPFQESLQQAPIVANKPGQDLRPADDATQLSTAKAGDDEAGLSSGGSAAKATAKAMEGSDNAAAHATAKMKGAPASQQPATQSGGRPQHGTATYQSGAIGCTHGGCVRTFKCTSQLSRNLLVEHGERLDGWFVEACNLQVGGASPAGHPPASVACCQARHCQDNRGLCLPGCG
jgi:hypothetical protein